MVIDSSAFQVKNYYLAFENDTYSIFPSYLLNSFLFWSVLYWAAF